MSDEKRLHQIEKEVAKLAAAVETAVKQNSIRITRMEAHLYGNPDADVPGLLIKADRMQQIVSRQNKLMWAGILAVLGFIGERLLTLLG